MKKQITEERNLYQGILPEYGRRKLHRYADSIQELAVSFREVGEEEENSHNQDRSEYFYTRRMKENKGIMAEHLSEMAELLTNVAEDSRKCVPMGERKYKQIAHALREVDLIPGDMCFLENEQGKMELSMELKGIKGKSLSAEELGDMLSIILGIPLTAAADNPFFTSGQMKAFFYKEDAAYHVLTGTALAIKENEEISGDNYSFLESAPGEFCIILSDGMGSGEKASKDSSIIIELMEKFLEAGFSEKMAVQMINSMLISGSEEGNMSTLDMCRMDLYNGTCKFLKIGSSASFIKRQNMVERISAGNLPLGIFGSPDMELTSRELQDGDYIIMVSDGVLDGLSQGIGEDMLSELISRIDLKNPGEIANSILQFCIRQCKGRIRDDMTVLVVGMWYKENGEYR